MFADEIELHGKTGATETKRLFSQLMNYQVDIVHSQEIKYLNDSM